MNETLPAESESTIRGQITPTVFSDVISLVQPARKGIAEIRHDSPSKMERMIGAMHGQPLTRETYCRLLINGSVMMTDADFERKTNMSPVIAAKGNALIAGLGIGMILAGFETRCDTVTVVEKEQDVIDLVSPSYPSVTVIHADINEWSPPKGTKYDTIYFDIWADICSDDLENAKALHKRFRKFLAPHGYMESWTRIANKYNRYR